MCNKCTQPNNLPIDEILAAIKRAYETGPSRRLGELLTIVAGDVGEEVLYINDRELIEELNRYTFTEGMKREHQA